jgi:hypothetical protein
MVEKYDTSSMFRRQKKLDTEEEAGAERARDIGRDVKLFIFNEQEEA